MLSERRFDVLLLDVDLGGHDGIRFAAEVICPTIRTCGLSW